MWQHCKNWCLKNKALLGVMLFAAALLVFRVGYRTFWMDETMVLNYFKYSIGSFSIEYLRNPDNHPPLFYMLVLLFSKVLPWTELMVRLVSIISGLGIVWLVFCFTERVTNNRQTALVAAFFTACSGYFVLISQMARYHALAGYTTLLALYFFYQLYIEGLSKRLWWYVAAMILVGYSDYPHFIYAALITNGLYLYRLIRKQPPVSLGRWVLGQAIVGLLCSPMVWMVYHRIVIQGDGGFTNVNLLANSWIHKTAALFFHVYSFFFGETILPWNYGFFGVGLAVLVAVLVGFIIACKKKIWTRREGYIIGVAAALIVLNTLIMNVADPRYNFIVYPKFGFVAYPFWIMTFVICLSVFKTSYLRFGLLCAWLAVAVGGLVHFYRVDNYLNPSYFRTFASFEYVRDHKHANEFLAITPDASEGVYLFYKEKYFSGLQQLPWEQIPLAKPGSRVWFFATSADGNETSVATDAIVPTGYTILERFDSVPLNKNIMQLKEKVLRRPSYTYKYSVFLLEKI